MYDTYEINIPPPSKLNIVCLCSYCESLNPGEVILMDKMDDIIHVNKIFFYSTQPSPMSMYKSLSHSNVIFFQTSSF